MSAESVQEFINSLPRRYRDTVDVSAAIAHARIAAERSSEPVHLGTFASKRSGSTALCIVAADQAGLLANISAAMVLCNLDVVDAELYTRTNPSGTREAVDLFWVRRTEERTDRDRISAQEQSELKDTLLGLLQGRISAADANRRAVEAARERRRDTVVRFIEGDDGSFSTLEVEAADRPGLLLALSQALFDQRLQIISSEVRTKEGHVFDRFTVTERDGTPINPERRLEIQVAVLSALEESLRC
jgi:[protein-PII] uridylyltransferase